MYYEKWVGRYASFAPRRSVNTLSNLLTFYFIKPMNFHNCFKCLMELVRYLALNRIKHRFNIEINFLIFRTKANFCPISTRCQTPIVNPKNWWSRCSSKCSKWRAFRKWKQSWRFRTIL